MPAADRKLTRARFAIMRDHPFFATILLQLQIDLTDHVATVDTDGASIRCNPGWLDDMPDRLLQTVLAHNAMHIAFEHPLRLQERDTGLANRAMDLAINPLLREAGFDLPDDAPIDPALADMPWEQIYAILEGQRADDTSGNQSPQRPSPGSGGAAPSSSSAEGQQGDHDAVSPAASAASPSTCGEVRPFPGEDGQVPSPAAVREARNQARVLLVQAAQAARRAGRLGGGLERLIGMQVQPSTDWQAVLRRFVSDRSRDGFSWSRPNRRHAWRGVILPSAYSQRLGEVVVVIDSSASIKQRELDAFAAEVLAIIDDLRPAAVTVIHCDVKVRSSARFTSFDDVAITPEGGGGTLFQPAFDWVEEHIQRQPACLLYFTDLAPADQLRDPGYPVLWIATSDRRPPPFGEVVQLDLTGSASCQHRQM